MSILAWHFVGTTLRDGRPVPPDGETLVHDGPLKLCRTGLHASERIICALDYAPGPTICRVRCGGETKRDTDKLVCRERTILWRVDGEALLREFARKQVPTDAQLWGMPNLVHRYLETGHKDLRRATAWDAARYAARAAARDAATAAAWAATRDAANAMLTEMVEVAHAKTEPNHD